MKSPKIFPIFLLLAFALTISAKNSALAKTRWENKYVSPSSMPDCPRPEVAFGQGKFGVVFDEKRDGNYEIYFSLLDRQGNKIGDDLRLTNDPGNSRDPIIASDGKDFGVFWFDNPTDHQSGVYFARVSSKGALEIGPTRINPDTSNGAHPSVVWQEKAKEYGVVWRDSRNEGVYFARVNRQGVVVKETPISLAATVRPLIASFGKQYGVMWADWYTCGSSCPEVAFARLDLKGEKLGDTSIVTSTGATGPLSLTSDSLGWAALVGKDNQAKLLRLSPKGEVVLPPTNLGPIDASNAKLAWNGRFFGVIWTDGRWITSENPLNSEIAFQTFGLAGNPKSEVERVSFGTGPSWNTSPPIVVGNHFALTWVENLYQPDQAIFFAKEK